MRPDDTLCLDSKTDVEVTSCVVGALNEAAGCVFAKTRGENQLELINTGYPIPVAYVDEIEIQGVPVDRDAGLTTIDPNGHASIQIARQSPWTNAELLAHEIGHVSGLRFEGDSVHSSNESDIMYYAPSGWITPSNLNAFVEQLALQGLDCEGRSWPKVSDGT